MHRWLGLAFVICISTFLAACGGISGGRSTSAPSAPASPISVGIVPASATVAVGQSAQFTATVSGGTSSGVTWQVNSVAGGNSTTGTVSTGGLYTAPAQLPNPVTVTVTAVSTEDSSKSASASVTIRTATASISITPGSARVPVFTTTQFSATINGAPSNAVTWQVNGVTGGASKTGTINSSGLFTAPNAVPVTSTSQHNSKTTSVTVQAVSQADPSASASAVVTVTTPNQNASGLPVPLGGSGGNAGDTSTSGTKITCCGGTLGALVSRGGMQYVLSNNHVLARSGLAALGDPVIQPGLIDVNCSSGAATTVANLSQFVNFDNPGKALADAAIARVVPGTVDPAGAILQLGAVNNGTLPTDGAPHAGSGVAPSVGLAVAKSGRSTGLTCSRIESVNVQVSVEYQKGCGTGTTFTKTFTDQVQVAGGEFSAQGDSGSLIVTQDTADPVALLYAGSDSDTVGNPVSDVLNALADPASGERPVFVGTAAPHPVAACSLPGPSAASASASANATTQGPSSDEVQRAEDVKERNAPRLLAHPEVEAVATGTSFDAPGKPAIVLFVNKGQSHGDIPAQVDGVRTRIVESEVFAHRGNLNAAQRAEMERDAEPRLQVTQLQRTQVNQARQAQEQHINDLMNLPGVQGVGVTSSVDSPGDAAVMIFIVRGTDPGPIPVTVDGIRTRIRESSRFQAGFGDNRKNTAANSSCSVPANTKSVPPVAGNKRARQ